MITPLHFPATATSELQRAVDEAHALSRTLFARATRLRDSGQADAARGVYTLGNQAFVVGMRVELQIEILNSQDEGRP